MANSPRMKWPYPAEGADPWYDAFESMLNAQDASAFALREAKNFIPSGGGTFSWSALTSVLQWNAPIVFNSPSSGFAESILAGQIVLANDGDVGYFSFISSPQGNVSLTMQAASTLPAADPDRPYILVRRAGSKIFFRNGGVLSDGDSASIIDDGPASTSMSLQAAYDAGQAISLTSGDLDITPSGTSEVNISAYAVSLTGTTGVDISGVVTLTDALTLATIPTASLPAPAPLGGFVYDLTTNELKYGNGTVWSAVVGGGGSATFNLPEGEAFTVGKLVAVDSAGDAYKADCTVLGRFPALGVVTARVPGTITVLPVGSASVFSGLTPGTSYCVGTDGDLATTPPLGAVVFQPALVAYSATSGVLTVSNQPIDITP